MHIYTTASFGLKMRIKNGKKKEKLSVVSVTKVQWGRKMWPKGGAMFHRLKIRSKTMNDAECNIAKDEGYKTLHADQKVICHGKPNLIHRASELYETCWLLRGTQASGTYVWDTLESFCQFSDKLPTSSKRIHILFLCISGIAYAAF